MTTDSKYSPEVNMPEKVPGNPANPESLMIFFLHSSGQWVGCDAKQLMLKQLDPGVIGLGFVIPDAPDKFRSFVNFPGVLTPAPAESTLVVP